MYVAVSRNERRQNFNIWVYGNEKLARGSGLFVGEAGVEGSRVHARHDMIAFLEGR
jgi:hypothetical protein